MVFLIKYQSENGMDVKCLDFFLIITSSNFLVVEWNIDYVLDWKLTICL